MFARLVRLHDLCLERLAMALVVALLGMVTAGIVSRAVNHPFSFTDEASGFLMVWLACIGWMLATRRGAHIRIRFFLDRLPVVPKLGTEIMIELGAVLLGAVIAWKALHVIEANSDVEATTMPISTAWMYVPLVPAGLLTLMQGLADLWQTLTTRAEKPA